VVFFVFFCFFFYFFFVNLKKRYFFFRLVVSLLLTSLTKGSEYAANDAIADVSKHGCPGSAESRHVASDDGRYEAQVAF
jgi:hypothetical protein